jgi:predicted Zn-dependent protease
MSILNEQQAKKLIDKVLSYSKAEEVNVIVNGVRTGNIRTARNTVSTTGETDNLAIQITSVFGKKAGTSTANEFDDASLEQAVRSSEHLAKMAPDNPEIMPMPGPQKYEQGRNYSENTAQIDPDFRADAALASIEPCLKNKCTSAGFLEDSTSFTAIGNNKGLFAYNKETSGEFTITVRTDDGKGSGYGIQSFIDAKKLDTKAVTEVAMTKAIASREAKELKPGKYTVILEPAAVADLVPLLVNSMDARAADEGRSYFGRRGLGDKLFNEKVNIYTDPFSPDNPLSPFTSEGMPTQKLTWIENGVVKNLNYNRYWAMEKGVKPTNVPFGFIMQGSDKTLNDLIKETKEGLLVTHFFYIRAVDPQTLLFTGLTRDGLFYVKDGEIKHAVKNFRFNESPATMLFNLEEVGQAVRIGRNLLPSMRVGNFNFTSLSDAV